jgi:transitional endoplasmic reticulum ATPase
MRPSNYKTLEITSETDFQWVDQQQARKHKSYGGQHSSEQTDKTDDETNTDTNQEDFRIEPRRPSNEDFDTFADVAGLDEVKKETKVVYGLADDQVLDEVKSHGKLFVPDEGSAVLLYGPPGCGKTMITEAIAHEFHKRMSPEKEVTFLSVEGSDILGKFQGESEERMSQAFSQAKDLARDDHFSILFFDEIEALVKDRSSEDVRAHHKQLTATFLQEMNTVGRDVMVIGATNLPFDIDSAAVRRFDTEIFVPHPGAEGMAELWKKELKAVNTVGPIDYEELGRLSAEFTPSEVSDRLLLSKIQSELVLNAMDDSAETIEINMKYLKKRTQETEPKVIDRYIAQVTQDFDDMGGYEELQEYIIDQYDQKGSDDQEKNN